jgi:hypothetical protein
MDWARRSRFDIGLVHVRLVEHKVVVEHVYLLLLRFYLVTTIPRRFRSLLRLNLYQKDKRAEPSNKAMLFWTPGSSERSDCFVRYRALPLPTSSQSLHAFIHFEH